MTAATRFICGEQLKIWMEEPGESLIYGDFSVQEFLDRALMVLKIVQSEISIKS
jgi:hypothetical protein